MNMVEVENTRLVVRETWGPALAGRDSGASLKTTIEALADEGAAVFVDFDGIDVITPGFADELFGRLRPDLIAAGRVQFVGLNDAASALMDLILRRRTLVRRAGA